MKRVAIGVLLVAGLGVGFAYWRNGTVEVEPQAPAAAPIAAKPPAAAAAGTAVETAAPPTAPENPRERVGGPQVTPPAETMATFAQGLRGVLVDGRQNPLAGVDVYLLESATNSPLELPVLLQRGLLMGPIAETRSAADGSFAIGLQLASEKSFDLRFASPAHADTCISDLHVLAGEWHDVGTVTMAPGLALKGRVTVEGTTTPVPRALVRIVAASAFEDAMQQVLPGREQGLAAYTEADGSYAIRNAPATGVVQMSAVAPGFARVVKKDIDLAAAATTAIDFGLPPGLVLEGSVVDTAGQPIARAQLEVWSKVSSTPACRGQTRADGSFQVLGLRDGKHLVKVRARGYQDLDLPEVAAGGEDLRITLRPRAHVLVRAIAPDGRGIPDFRAGLRRLFAGKDGGRDQIGRVADVPDQRARLAPGVEALEMLHVPPGSFVVQVTADGFAKSRSVAFTVDEATALLRIDVPLTAGAELRGVVVGEDGQPLAGATVRTQADGAVPDNPLWRMLRQNAPDDFTEAAATTGADGGFALTHLAFADYQLEITHADACRAFVGGLALRQVERRDLGTVRLATGALVFGRATVGGSVRGQVRLVLATAVDAGPPPPNPVDTVLLETVTDSTGAFRFPRRVPAGSYELRAAALDAGNADAQALQRILQLQQNAQRLVVAPGQRQLEHHLDLPPQH